MAGETQFKGLNFESCRHHIPAEDAFTLQLPSKWRAEQAGYFSL